MYQFIHHWLYEDIWVPVWPNWVAGAVVAPLAFLWGKAFEKRSIARHNEVKNHLLKIHKHLGIK